MKEVTLKVDTPPNHQPGLRRWLVAVVIGALIANFGVLLFIVDEAQALGLPVSDTPPVLETSSPSSETPAEKAPIDSGLSNDTSDSVTSSPEETSSLGAAEPLTEEGAAPADPVLNQATETSEPVIEEAAQTVKPVAKSAESLVEEASPLVQAVEEATDPVVTATEETVAPISKAASQVLDPVVAPVREAVAPVVGLVDEVTEPVAISEIADPILAPLAEETAPVLGSPDSSLEPVFAPAPAGPVEAASTFSADSDITSVAQVNLEGSASNVMAADDQATAGSYLEQVGLSLLFDEALLPLNLVEMEGTQNQVPQPFPAGAIPVAGGYSGGSSSGGGLDAGILGLLVVLLVGGKFFWSTRDFLKPNSAPLLAIEQPG